MSGCPDGGILTVQDVLEAAREAAIEIRRIEEQKQARLTALGPGGHTYDAHPKVGILDPMRHMDALMDWQDEQMHALNLQPPIEDGYTLMSGIERVADSFDVEVATRYYLQAESWREIARSLEGRVEFLQGHTRDEQVLILSKSLEHCVEQWNSIGIAHLKEMGR